MSRPCLMWFTGLSGAGKSTLANALAQLLKDAGLPVYVLDGDRLRTGLNSDLGFSVEDRSENIRRIGEVARLMTEAGLVVLVAAISPMASDRARVRGLFQSHEFLEVYVSTPLAVCEARDPKGLYRRVRAGVLKQFTGVDSPYESPGNPELSIDTSRQDLDSAVAILVDCLRRRGVLDGPG